MKSSIISFFLIFVFVSNISAQKKYTLEECKKLAEQNNTILKNSQLSIEEAKQTQKEAFTNYLPSVSASVFAFKSSNPLVDVDLGSTKISLLESGITGSVTAMQPIYAGGKIHNENKLSELGIEINIDKRQLSKNEVVIETAKKYWQIVSFTEKLKTIRNIQNSLNALMKQVEKSYQAGLSLSNDVLRVKLKQNENDASESKITNAILLSKMTLCQYIGLSVDSVNSFEITLPDSTLIVLPRKYFADHESAVQNRPELRLLNKSIKVSYLNTKIKESEYLPKISVGLNYGYDNFIKKTSFSGTVFATVSIPISDWWGGSHALKRQHIKETIAKNNYKEGKELLLLEMQKTQNEFIEAFKQTLLTKLSIEESIENLRLNTNYYNAGTVNLTQVLDAQNLLIQSKNNYTDACIQYFIYKDKYIQMIMQ